MRDKSKFKWSDLLDLAAVTIPEVGRGLGETLYHHQEREGKAFQEEIKRQKEQAKEEERLLKKQLEEKKLEERILAKELKEQKKWYEKKGLIKTSDTKALEKGLHDVRQEILSLVSSPMFEAQEALSPTEPKRTLSKSAEAPIEDPELLTEPSLKGGISKEEEKRQADALLNFMKADTNLGDILPSTVSGVMELGEGLTGILGLQKAKEAIRSGKEKYESVAVKDRNSFGAKTGRFLGEMLIPLGAPAKLFKWAKRGAPLLRALSSGGLYGALSAEAQDENPIEGAIIGAGTGATVHGLGSSANKVFGKKKLAKELQAMKKDATLKAKEDILHASDLMGEKATIGEIVGSEKTVKRMKDYPKRLTKIEERLKEKAGTFAETIPQNEKLQLYENLAKHKTNVTEEASRLYDVVKESGIGQENILDRKTMQRWVNAIKEVLPHTKGLPNLKGTKIASKKNLQEIENLLLTAPHNPEEFKRFMITHEDKLPYAEDFLKFRSKIRGLQAKADSSNKQALDILDNSLNKIIEDVDVQGTLAKANKNYAALTAPVKQASLDEAITAVKFPEAAKGAPKVSSIFGKQSTANSQFFEQLSTEDKNRVIGGFIQEAFEKKGKEHPSRALHEAWYMLPDYIKHTDDKAVQEILRGLKTIAQKNKTLSSLQQTTNASIGSRKEARQIGSFIRNFAYLGSLSSGEPSITAAVAAGHLGTKGAKSLLNKAYRSRTGHKNLKYFLRPELLDEIIAKEEGKYSRPMAKALILGRDFDKE